MDDRWLVEDESAGTLHKLRVLADDQYVVRFDEGGGLRGRTAGSRPPPGAACSPPSTTPSPGATWWSCPTTATARPRTPRSAVCANCARRGPARWWSTPRRSRRYADAGATIVTPNLLEARLAVEPGQAATAPGRLDLAAVERVGRGLLALLDAEHAAITLAADGVLLLDRAGAARHLPAHPVAQANDVGAGDSFTAALALALAAGAEVEEAARIGIDAAGIAVTKRRTAVVTARASCSSGWGCASGPQGARPTLAELAARLDAERRAGRTIVFTNGCFDILHAGHVQLLRQARALGDLLVVGVNSDRGVRRLKGPRRPINHERDRLALVAALDPVDHAILFDEDQPSDLIRALRPHIHVKGGDYAGEALPEAAAVREVGGRMAILPLVGGLSTTGLIDRVLALSRPRGSTRAEGEGRVTTRQHAAGTGDDWQWRAARRILAVRLDNLGDVLVTTPALHAIKASLPDAHLTLLASPVGAQVGRLNPDLDGVIAYQAPWMDPWRRLPQDSAREQRMIATIRAGRFDGAIIFGSFRQSPLPAAYLCYLAGIPRAPPPRSTAPARC